MKEMKHMKKYDRSAHGMCTCVYRTHWHLLVWLRKCELLVRWSQLWDVSDAWNFRSHESCKEVVETARRLGKETEIETEILSPTSISPAACREFYEHYFCR